jgi:hypothetical protein
MVFLILCDWRNFVSWLARQQQEQNKTKENKEEKWGDNVYLRMITLATLEHLYDTKNSYKTSPNIHPFNRPSMNANSIPMITTTTSDDNNQNKPIFLGFTTFQK